MAFSSRTLLNLQRLARVVKKESQIAISIRNAGGISDLLRRTAIESHNSAIIDAYNNFLVSLTEQDKTELAIYNVPALSESSSVIRTAESNENKAAKQDRALSYDRRQRTVHVDHDRRKKPVMYRGTAIKTDRRQQDRSYPAPDRRGRGLSQNESQDKNKEMETQQGVDGQAESKKKKSVRMYRGKPISDND